MKHYTTLHNIKYDLNNLTETQQDFVNKVILYYKQNPHWNKFSNYWQKSGKDIWKDMDRKDVVKHPTFKIAQDLESRLGIEQGFVRKSD